jgi:hypothetical protein
MATLPPVQAMFLKAFDTALRIDGEDKTLRFSDGVTVDGRIEAIVRCLWARDSSSYLHLHSHGMNTVLQHHERILMFKAADVPEGARLYANQYIDVGEEQFKIIMARRKDELWTLHLLAVGSR